VDQPDLDEVLIVADILPITSPLSRPSLAEIREGWSPQLSWLGLLPQTMERLQPKLRLLPAQQRTNWWLALQLTIIRGIQMLWRCYDSCVAQALRRRAKNLAPLPKAEYHPSWTFKPLFPPSTRLHHLAISASLATHDRAHTSPTRWLSRALPTGALRLHVSDIALSTLQPVTVTDTDDLEPPPPAAPRAEPAAVAPTPVVCNKK
jgi:hypothetical protein